MLGQSASSLQSCGVHSPLQFRPLLSLIPRPGLNKVHFMGLLLNVASKLQSESWSQYANFDQSFSVKIQGVIGSIIRTLEMCALCIVHFHNTNQFFYYSTYRTLKMLFTNSWRVPGNYSFHENNSFNTFGKKIRLYNLLRIQFLGRFHKKWIEHFSSRIRDWLKSNTYRIRMTKFIVSR